MYPDFKTAVTAAPKGARIGYDSEEMSTGLYRDMIDRVYECDYPVMFWLRSLLRPDLRIFDVGGYIGLSYYGYRKYLEFPAGLTWTVEDVPAVVKAGRAFAAERHASDLSFVETIREGDGSDVLIASGSLQFIEQPLSSEIATMKQPPRDLMLHKLPLTTGPSFVTLQNTVHAFSPYNVFNRDEFVRSFETLGYALVDSWSDHERSILLPSTPTHSVSTYSGMYLRRS